MQLFSSSVKPYEIHIASEYELAIAIPDARLCLVESKGFQCLASFRCCGTLPC